MNPKFKCNHCKSSLEIGEIHTLHGTDVTDDLSFGMPYSTGRKLCQDCFNAFTSTDKEDKSSGESSLNNKNIPLKEGIYSKNRKINSNEILNILRLNKSHSTNGFQKRPKKLYKSEIYNQLKIWRYDLSKQKGIPAYCIFSNKILEAISVRKPLTLHELRYISGVGLEKAKKYGKEVLAIVSNR
jgi:superfamily II DNA helicase RecQ